MSKNRFFLIISLVAICILCASLSFAGAKKPVQTLYGELISIDFVPNGKDKAIYLVVKELASFKDSSGSYQNVTGTTEPVKYKVNMSSYDTIESTMQRCILSFKNNKCSMVRRFTFNDKQEIVDVSMVE